MKQILTRANSALYRRAPDERFTSLDALRQHCQEQKAQSTDLWEPPQNLQPIVNDGRLELAVGAEAPQRLNDWSFTQLCGLAGVTKDTVNRLTPQTAKQVFTETLPDGNKPLQVHTCRGMVRSVHAASYTRLHNTELLSVISEFATDFQPPQESGGPGETGGTGLYCGEQDLFVFLIDPLGWTEIGGEHFAPGFFVWNSEVGRRSLGIQNFWYQSVCANHLVTGAVEVAEFSRKHTASVHDGLREIRRLIEQLVNKRDARRDGFAKVIANAMERSLGTDEENVLKTLSSNGVSRALARQALQIARESGRFTIFSVVDALTRIAGSLPNAGDRTEADATASSLLALAR